MTEGNDDNARLQIWCAKCGVLFATFVFKTEKLCEHCRNVKEEEKGD